MGALFTTSWRTAGSGISSADATPLDKTRLTAHQTGHDKVAVAIVSSATSFTLRPVYTFDTDEITTQFEDPSQDVAFTAPGNFYHQFEAWSGCRMGFKVVAVAGGSVAMRYSFGKTERGY